MTPAQFVEGVDTALGITKGIVGAETPTWRNGRDVGEKRLKLPLEIEGEQLGQHLLVMAYPNHFSLKFRIGIECFGKIVCRLDFELEGTHGNNLTPHALPLLVRGPHWHPWELNRREVASVLYYDALPFAVAFTESHQFDASLRWYCKKRNITLGSHGITFPPKEMLL